MRPVPTRPTVLVLDSDDMVRAVLVAMLEDGGYRALTAWDTDESWAILTREHIDLILCDALLLYLSGLAFRDRLLADPDFATIPFILTSIDDEPPRHARRYQGFLAKP